MAEQNVADRVKECLAEIKNLEPIAMADISERAVAVFDNFKETDLYFDADSYVIKNPGIWKGGEALFPAVLDGTGLGMLPGAALGKGVDNFYQALLFATLVLEPKNKEANWYHAPRNFQITFKPGGTEIV